MCKSRVDGVDMCCAAMTIIVCGCCGLWSHIDGGLFEVCMVVKREVPLRDSVSGCREKVARGFVAA